MLEPKGCDSIVAGARQKDQRDQSPCPAFQHRYRPAWPPIHPAPVRASDRLGRGLLSDGIVLGRQIERPEARTPGQSKEEARSAVKVWRSVALLNGALVWLLSGLARWFLKRIACGEPVHCVRQRRSDVAATNSVSLSHV
jgi:hypothetical protein